ncbi:3'-5' exonuclease [Polynucleobacter acidiphobus]|uniref:3'-5' exonuclease n=1 Tax=Polynucleobacter acidiphobus TaxID=556053 RepID=UPI000D35B542|nr:3'-5' exonuclease [Polynucleobacter acidiphobus]
MFASLLARFGFSSPVPEPNRWVVLDVETTGLDPHRDRLLAIAAIAVEVGPGFTRPSIILGDSYEAVLRQEFASDKDNILVHHIGVGAQKQGRPAVEVLEEFRHWVGNSPLLAFHAPFDQAMINRAYQQLNLAPLGNDWIDIEPLAALSGLKPKARALDDWLSHFGIECAVRHQAAADTLATCELLLCLWSSIAREANSLKGLKTLAQNAAWIPRS